MKKPIKKRASLLVSALVIFTFVTTVFLIVFTYANNNFQHAKIQEESIHAYYLAYSGAEIAYESLKKEADDLVPSSSAKSKWETLVEQFRNPPDANFLSKHKVCISFEGKISESGYITKEFQRAKKGKTGKELSELISDFKDSIILIEVTRLPNSHLSTEEEQYPGFIRIKSRAKKAIGTSFEGTSTKTLYVDPVNPNKVHWK